MGDGDRVGIDVGRVRHPRWELQRRACRPAPEARGGRPSCRARCRPRQPPARPDRRTGLGRRHLGHSGVSFGVRFGANGLRLSLSPCSMASLQGHRLFFGRLSRSLTPPWPAPRSPWRSGPGSSGVELRDRRSRSAASKSPAACSSSMRARQRVEGVLVLEGHLAPGRLNRLGARPQVDAGGGPNGAGRRRRLAAERGAALRHHVAVARRQ